MTLSPAFKMAIRPFGDSALLVNVDAGSPDASSDIVMALNAQLHYSIPVLLPKRRQATATYSSALSSSKCNTSLQSEIHAIADAINVKDMQGESVVFTGMLRRAYALDRVALETELSQDWQSIVDCFCATGYRVHAVGFLPGFTYLGIFQTHCTDRLRDPRQRCLPHRLPLPALKPVFIPSTRRADGGS